MDWLCLGLSGVSFALCALFRVRAFQNTSAAWAGDPKRQVWIGVGSRAQYFTVLGKRYARLSSALGLLGLACVAGWMYFFMFRDAFEFPRHL